MKEIDKFSVKCFEKYYVIKNKAEEEEDYDVLTRLFVIYPELFNKNYLYEMLLKMLEQNGQGLDSSIELKIKNALNRNKH